MTDAKIIDRLIGDARKEMTVLEEVPIDMTLQDIRKIIREYELSYPEALIVFDADEGRILMLEGEEE